MDAITSAALVVVDSSPAGVSSQASSDDEMVALWLATYRSPHTRRAYEIDVRAFCAFVGKPLCTVTVRDLQAFSATKIELPAATAARHLSAIKSLISFAHRIGYLTFDVGAPVQLPAIKDALAERILTEWEVQRMLELEPQLRNAALLRLIYSAGLRISEACGLRWRDLTPRDEAGQINVFGKGGKTRAVLLRSALWKRLSALRDAAGPDDPVFRSRRGGALAAMQVHRITKAAAKRAGLPVAVSTHWLRHAHVSHSLDRGAPVHVVQATVGHASLQTTTRYAHARPGDSSARYLTD